jgi:AraC family transcriptional regulator
MRKADAHAESIYVSPARFAIRCGGARRVSLRAEAATDFHFLFALGGALRWTVGGDETGQADEGDALLIPPGAAFDATSTAAADFLLASLSPALVLDCAARARLTRDDASVTFRSRVARDARLVRVARDLAEELREESAGRSLVVESLVEQMLVQVLRRHANIQRASGLELSRAGLVDRRVRRAVELMHAQLDRELPLEELAATAHLSPFHFARLFKKLTGAAPHAYLAALRAARARELLADPDLSITDVAARVGYASSSHFSKAFRRAHGLSPRAFRKALVRP